MKGIASVSILMAAGLFIATFAISDVAAKSGGMGHGFSGGGKSISPTWSWHGRGRRGFPYYAYPGSAYPYYGQQAGGGSAPLSDDSLVTGSIAPSTPPPPDCKYSQDVVTVPASGGGTREIRITRC